MKAIIAAWYSGREKGLLNSCTSKLNRCRRRFTCYGTTCKKEKMKDKHGNGCLITLKLSRALMVALKPSSECLAITLSRKNRCILTIALSSSGGRSIAIILCKERNCIPIIGLGIMSQVYSPSTIRCTNLSSALSMKSIAIGLVTTPLMHSTHLS